MLTSLSSPWVKKIKTDKIWLYESVGKLKGIGNQGEVKRRVPAQDGLFALILWYVAKTLY